MISKGVGCSKRGVVYEITCNLCGEKYQGETDRPLNHRIKERIRACRNPQSYPNNALGHHFLTVHPTCQVDISVSVLAQYSEAQTIRSAIHLQRQAAVK